MLTTAWLSISTIPVITYAAVQSWDVHTPGVRAAKMTFVAALINILTHITIAGKPRKAHAFMRAHSVFAFCIPITLVSSISTFINVMTWLSIPYESLLTSACVGADGVIANCVITTIVFIGIAFINILTGSSIPQKSFVTLTTVRANSVIAWCMNTTTRKSIETTAFIGTYNVVTHCMVATVVDFALTLIDILAGVTFAVESCQTAAIVRANGIYTKCMLTACGRISFTFINVLTRESISLEATITNTFEMSLIFWICFACSVSITKWLLAAVKTCR